MEKRNYAAEAMTEIVQAIITLAIVLTPSVLIYRKYGLPEASAFFVIAATLMEIRSRLANRKETS